MDQRLKIEVFMIGLGNELSIKIGLIMKKTVMRKNMFGRMTNGVQGSDKKPEKKSSTPKE